MNCLGDDLHCQLKELGLLDRALIKVLNKETSDEADEFYGERLPSEEQWDYYIAEGTVKVNPRGNPFLRYGQGIERDLDLTIYRLPYRVAEETEEDDETSEDEATVLTYLPREKDFLIHRGVEYHVVGIEPINPAYVNGAETQTGWRVYAKKFS